MQRISADLTRLDPPEQINSRLLIGHMPSGTTNDENFTAKHAKSAKGCLRFSFALLATFAVVIFRTGQLWSLGCANLTSYFALCYLT